MNRGALLSLVEKGQGSPNKPVTMLQVWHDPLDLWNSEGYLD